MPYCCAGIQTDTVSRDDGDFFLFRPLIVMDVQRPIPVGSCCSFVIVEEIEEIESIATPPGL